MKIVYSDYMDQGLSTEWDTNPGIATFDTIQSFWNEKGSRETTKEKEERRLTEG